MRDIEREIESESELERDADLDEARRERGLPGGRAPREGCGESPGVDRRSFEHARWSGIGGSTPLPAKMKSMSDSARTGAPRS